MSFGPWVRRCESLAAAAEPFLLWVFLSLLAITWVGRWPYVALAMALLGGLAMGLSCVASYSHTERDSGQRARQDPARREE
jgi:hypothetical protein